MPIINGQELAEAITKIRSDIPVYICSASIDYNIEKMAEMDVLPEIIPKPSSFEEVESLLSRVTTGFSEAQ